jgi:hypothetical protein
MDRTVYHLRRIFTFGLDLHAPLQCWMGFCLLLLVYFFTSARDLYWFDSAELALAGLQGGLAHPPGQPLHTLLLHLGAGGEGEPLLWMNFLSNLAGALCVIPACSLCFSLLGERRRGFLVSTLVPVLVAGAGLMPQLWESSARIEVYSPAGFLALMEAALLVPVIAGRREATRLFWFVQGLLLGLLGSLNPMLMVIQAAAGASAVIVSRLTKKMTLDLSVLLVLAGCAAGLLPYIHVFAVAGATDRFVWGAPTGEASFLFYVTGKDYAGNLGASLADVIRHVGIFFLWSMRRGILVLLALGAAGWIVLLWRRWSELVLLSGVFVMSILWVCMNKPYFPDVPDFYNYLFPALWLVMIGAAILIVRILLELRSGKVRRFLFPAAAAIWVMAMALLPPAIWRRARTENTVPRKMALAALDETPKGAILLAGSDHLFFPLFYLTEGEGRRPDVVLVNPGWASSSWYWDMIYRRHPDLQGFDPKAAPNRWARIESFLLANYDRPVVAENLFLAGLSGRMACMGGWLLWTDRLCMENGTGERQKRRDAALAQLRQWASTVGQRRTVDERVLAYVGASWGHDETAMGKLRGALKSYLAGAGMGWKGIAEVVHDGPLVRPPAVSGPILLSTPARNVAYASHLLELFDPALSQELQRLSFSLRY